MPVAMRLVSVQVAGLMTLTVSSSELSTKTGLALGAAAEADTAGTDAGREGADAVCGGVWAVAAKHTSKPVKAHSRGAAK